MSVFKCCYMNIRFMKITNLSQKIFSVVGCFVIEFVAYIELYIRVLCQDAKGDQQQESVDVGGALSQLPVDVHPHPHEHHHHHHRHDGCYLHEALEGLHLQLHLQSNLIEQLQCHHRVEEESDVVLNILICKKVIWIESFLFAILGEISSNIVFCNLLLNFSLAIIHVVYRSFTKCSFVYRLAKFQLLICKIIIRVSLLQSTANISISKIVDICFIIIRY